jgi:uncharacterized protein (DUF2252 family)
MRRGQLLDVDVPDAYGGEPVLQPAAVGERVRRTAKASASPDVTERVDTCVGQGQEEALFVKAVDAYRDDANLILHRLLSPGAGSW